MSDIYRTISSASESVFTEKRSKFLAFAFPVETVDDVKQIVSSISKKYFDARHVCWAYMLGPERKDFRTNDNGEPSGTAGKPILGQINSFELTNVLVVVVRYFGGIKLGTSGLIAAYRQAARDVLDASDIVEKHQTVDISLSFPYIVINDVMKISREPGIESVESKFDNTCQMNLRVEKDKFDYILRCLEAVDGVTIDNNNLN